MESHKKTAIAILAVLALLFVLITVWGLYGVSSLDDRSSASELVAPHFIQETVGGVPIVTNTSPEEGFVGSDYLYRMAIEDSDSGSEDITIRIVEGPEWLKSSGWTIYGIPTAIGEYKVVVAVSDGDHTIYERFIIHIRTHERQ